MKIFQKYWNIVCGSRKRIKILLLVGVLTWIYAILTFLPFRARLESVVYEKPVLQFQQETISLSSRGSQNAGRTHGLPRHDHSSYGHCQSDDFVHVHGTSNTTALKYFTKQFELTKEPVKSWLQHEASFCDGALRVFDNRFGILRDVIIDPKERKDVDSLAKGGEGIEDVKSQSLNKEDFVFKHGFYSIACKDSSFGAVTYDKMKQLRTQDSIETSGNVKTIENFTIAIARGDYANLWNHMFELYGVFLMMMVFNKQPSEVSVLFLDGHPSCLLDKNWEHIFGPAQRVGRLEGPVLYKNLVWGLAENQIPLSKWENAACPYVEEFRTFVLNQYGIVEDAKKLNCKKLTFTFIVRRNQVYHPRNLEGNVQRKIFNELEVIEILMDRFPGVCIQALLMESIPMRAQLEIISETDVLIGMHGAGMMHTTFLPRHSGVVELFPERWRETRKHAIMYEILSVKWRGLKYGSWQNPDPKRAFNDKVTIVDTDMVYKEVKSVIDKMCNPP